MKHITKSISIALAFIMLVSVFTALPLAAGAVTTDVNSTSITSDDLAYDILDDGTLEITGYNGSDTIVIIPPEIDGKLVTQIGQYAFSRCTELIKIILPNTITSIGDGAFWRCENITSINIPDSVTYIGENAFEMCDALTSITIPDNVTSIGDNVFWNCTSLTSVIIGNKVETIGKFTFAYCESLTSITIPDSVTRIGLGAFEYCESLTAITIPDRVIEIGRLAFSNCTSLIDIEVDENNVTYSSLDGNLYNKNQTELIQYAAGKIDTSFTIPDSVTNIGDSAFSSCASLETVIIPESVTSIDSFVFSDCSSLINIIIPNSVTEIKHYAFFWCTSLVNVLIPNSVTEIDGPIFSNCTSLINIEVDEENKVYSSLNGNLYNKDKTELILYAIGKTDTSFIVPDSVTYIGESAFAYCETLENIIIPDSVTYIDSGAFSECKSLTSITIPGSVIVIDTDAFAGCIGLANVTIENGVKKIGERAFAYCTGLKSVTISDGVTSTNRTFYGCTGLTNITIPTSITQIGEYTFRDCDSLEDVLYLGSSEMWDSIDISDDGNNDLINANIHFDCKFVGTTAPDCTNKGYNLYSCSECEDLVKIGYTNALGHDIVNGACTRCGKDEFDCIESEHPYADNTDESWTIHKDGAKRIAITFSEETETESGCDFIYIYNMNGDEVGCYSGMELAGKRIVVQGDTIKIRLTSDSSYSCFGFALTEIKEEYNDSEEPTESSSATATTPSQGTTTTEPTEGTTATEPSENSTSYTSGDFEYRVLGDGTAEITKYNGDATKLVIPNTIDGYKVTSIGESAFDMCLSLTSITIPDSVTSIGEGAFQYCQSLTSITIPNSVTVIADSVFYCCTEMTSITIPNSVTEIGDWVFYHCISLTNITIPDSVISIGDRAFGYHNYINGSEKTDNFTITGYSGTAAEKYANENEFKFISLGEAPATENTTATEPSENSTSTDPTEEPTTTDPTESTSQEATTDPTEPSSTDSSESESTEPTSSQEKEKTDISNWNVFGISDKTYTGGKITQSLIMVYKGSEYATFTTTYKNNVNAGTATLILSGTGKYTGTIVKTFTINKAKQSMTATSKTKTVKYSKVKKAKQTVKKAITVKNNIGAVTYSKVKSGSSPKLTINKSGKITVKKKTKTGTYKIKVKVTAKGNKNYKSASKTVTVKIKVK